MAYATRWQMTFKDFYGTTRNVYIQQDGWTGGVTSLTPGGNPVDWDENSNSDVLTRVRAKTGHIEVIEHNYGDLVDLFPTTARSHRVVIPDMFYGYLKPQTARNRWESGPRKLKFEMVSPLSMADDINMNGHGHGINYYVRDFILDILKNLEYTHIIMPVGTGNHYDFFEGLMAGTFVSPYATDKAYNIPSDAAIYNPISCKKMLEIFGDRHDWVAHDVCIGNNPVLLIARFTSATDYYKWAIADIESEEYTCEQVSNETLTDIYDLGAIASDSNSEELVLAKSGIDVYYDGEMVTSAEWTSYLSQYIAPNLIPRGNWFRTEVPDKAGLVNYSVESTDAIRFGGSITPGYEMFNIMLGTVDFAGYYLQFKVRGASSVGMALSWGGQWYDFVNRTWGQWSQNCVESISIASLTNNQYQSHPIYVRERVQVHFYAAESSYSGLYFWDFRISLAYDNTGYTRLRKTPYVESIEGTIGTQRLTYRLALNDRFNSNLYSTDLNFGGNTYPIYVLQTQNKVIITLRTSHAFVASDYLNKYYIDQTGRRWRIVAISQQPRDCIVKVTLISSYILES